MIMQEITQMVRTLCLLTPVLFVLQMLIPSGRMRKYARFVFALVEILAMLSPVVSLLKYFGKVI